MPCQVTQVTQVTLPGYTCVTWQGVSSLVDGIDQTAYMDTWKKYHKTACTSLPEDEHLVVRNMPKTLSLN
jgi:hypothetical protein